MELLTRFKTGLSLTRRSFTVARRNPTLAVYPLLMLIAAAIAAAALFYSFVMGITFSVEQGIVNLDQSDQLLDVLLIAGLFVFYLVLTFILTFFSTALVHASYDAFYGRSSDTYRSLKAATGSVIPIFIWSVVSATVGVALQLIGERVRGASLLFSMAWAAMTFFIVPVIALERTSVKGMFTQSGSTFKDVWGESAVGATGVGVVQGAILLIGGTIAAGVWFVSENGQLVLAIGAVTVILILLIGLTVGGVVKTALYLYANGEELPDEFKDINPDELIKEDNQSPTSPFDTDTKSGQI